ncbi:MAG: hypothetical protein ACRC5V_01060, partial [Aeromonas sp.]
SQLVKNSEQTVIISTHRPSLLEVVDRIIVFEKGRIIADGPKSAILARANNAKMQASEPIVNK